MNGNFPLIISCSSRAGGNSDFAADLLAKAIHFDGGGEAEILRIGRMNIIPCSGCLRCRTAPNKNCILADCDQAEEIFTAIINAPVVFFIAPIYFYHLPAKLKALIDRAQRFYEAKTTGDTDFFPGRPKNVYLILLAGRPEGPKLFQGSLLTMKYFLDCLGCVLAEPLLLHNIDDPADLKKNAEATTKILEYIRNSYGDFLSDLFEIGEDISMNIDFSETIENSPEDQNDEPSEGDFFLPSQNSLNK